MVIPKPGAPCCGNDDAHRAAEQSVDMYPLREAHPILSKEGTRAKTRGGGVQGHSVLATSPGAPVLAAHEGWPPRLMAVPPAVLTWGSVSGRVCGDGQLL